MLILKTSILEYNSISQYFRIRNKKIAITGEIYGKKCKQIFFSEGVNRKSWFKTIIHILVRMLLKLKKLNLVTVTAVGVRKNFIEDIHRYFIPTFHSSITRICIEYKLKKEYI